MKIYALDEMHPAGLEWLSQFNEVIRCDDPRRQHWYEDAEGVMVRSVPVPGEEIRQAKHLRVLSKQGVGFNLIDLQACKEGGVIVCNTPGVNRIAVAEMAMALTLALARRVPEFDRMIRQGRVFNRNNFPGMELTGKTVGVIGMGNTGTEYARMMQGAFRMRVLAYGPSAPADAWPDIAHERVASLDQLWPQADVISLHIPYRPQNHHLINAAAMAAMKPGALLINISRGGLIDEEALHASLVAGHLGGAGLDVWQGKEPPDASHPLLALPQVVATPHAAAGTEEALMAGSLAVAQQLWHVLQGGEPWSRVV